MEDLLMKLLTVVVEIAVLILTPYLVKLLTTLEQRAKSTLGATNYELAKSFATTVVKAVEQTNPKVQGQQKYLLAFDAIDNKFGDYLTQEEIQHLIEAAVKEYNVAIGKPIE